MKPLWVTHELRVSRISRGGWEETAGLHKTGKKRIAHAYLFKYVKKF